MKASILFSALVLTSALCADDDIVAAAQKPSGKSQPPTTKTNNNNNNSNLMNVVTLTSARPESNNGWYLFADALYWHVDIGSTDWAEVISSVASSDVKNINHSLNFKWDWGFRVGIGANIDHDMWDTNFYYTWLFADSSNRAGKEGSTVVNQFTQFQPAGYTTGSIKWDLHFSMFDWELGRWHYVSKSLALRPHVGVKGGWINQQVRAEFSNDTDVQLNKFENDFWGVGPSLGLNTLWVLGNAGTRMDHRFSLFGDFAGALMYGHFEVSNSMTLTSAADVTRVHGTGLDRNLATTMLQGIMGLSWDTAFNKNKNHFMLKAGYEFQYWFRQNQLLVAGSAQRIGNGRLSDDLALQGVTVEFRFDF